MIELNNNTIAIITFLLGIDIIDRTNKQQIQRIDIGISVLAFKYIKSNE
jgi:hypothetical protein